MLIECPHCYTMVLPESDNTCPACRKNTKDFTDADLNYSLIDIREDDKLPNVCYKCGVECNDFVKIESSRKLGQESGFMNTLFLLFAPRIFLLDRNSNGRYTRLKYNIPACKKCKNLNPIEPQYIDYENYSISILVHKNFKNLVKNMK